MLAPVLKVCFRAYLSHMANEQDKVAFGFFELLIREVLTQLIQGKRREARI